jgi:hypothetical protein
MATGNNRKQYEQWQHTLKITESSTNNGYRPWKQPKAIRTMAACRENNRKAIRPSEDTTEYE